MTVYIDSPTYYPDTPLRFKVWSHMWADTLDELHAMADKIGIHRSWFQCNVGPKATKLAILRAAHYDVTPRKRETAIHLGAIPMEISEWYETIWAVAHSP